MNMPFNLYAILSLPPPLEQMHRSANGPIDADAVHSALQSKLEGQNFPPELAYASDNAKESRAVLLQRASNVLTDASTRAEYDATLRDDGDAMDIPTEHVFGALLLLCESYAFTSAINITISHSLLQFRDGALVYAVSHAELSSQSVNADDGSAVEACNHLYAALSALRRHGKFAQQLQTELEHALDELGPAYVLEQISLPLDAIHDAHRQEGIRGLRSLLWERDETGVLSPNIRDRQAFISEANRHLTAWEQALLFADAPEYVPAEPWEIYNAAVAHVVAGFVQGNPRLVLDADELFSLLDGTNESERHSISPSMRRDVSTERSVCALLLGRVEACKQRLGLTNGTCDRDVHWFVLDYAQAAAASVPRDQSDADLLPGLCALSERWLADVGFKQFRDTQELPDPSLDDWFNEPSVQRALNALDRPKFLRKLLNGIASAAAATQKLQHVVLKSIRPKHQQSNRPNDSTEGNGVANWLTDRARRDPSSLKQAAYIAAVGAAALGGASYAMSTGNQNSSSGGGQVTLIERAKDGMLDIAGSKVSNVDKQFAEKVVRRWQNVKADALGPRHRIDRLQSVLDGDMLRYWQANAKETDEEGYYWTYSLGKLKVNKIEQPKNTKRAVIEATIREAATLCDAMSGEGKDSYESTYRARYTLEQCGSGGIRGWKLVNGRTAW